MAVTAGQLAREVIQRLNIPFVRADMKGMPTASISCAINSLGGENADIAARNADKPATAGC
jgi:hypothetical protein